MRIGEAGLSKMDALAVKWSGDTIASRVTRSDVFRAAMVVGLAHEDELRKTVERLRDKEI